MVNKIRRRSHLSYNQPKVFSPRKEKEPRKSLNPYPLINICIALIVAVVILYLLFFSGLFLIKDVLVEGNQLISKERIVASVPSGRNIFLTSSDQIKTEILNDVPEIKDVQVYKGIPNAVKIVVLEHNQSLVWKSNGRSYLLSSEGYVYRDITDEIANYQSLPRVEDNNNLNIDHKSKIVNASFVSFVQNVQNNFFSTVNIEPDYFYITESTFDLYLKTKAGFVVKFDTLRSSKKQMDDLKKVLDEKREQITEYVDLRVDGWAYYK